MHTETTIPLCGVGDPLISPRMLLCALQESDLPQGGRHQWHAGMQSGIVSIVTFLLLDERDLVLIFACNLSSNTELSQSYTSRRLDRERLERSLCLNQERAGISNAAKSSA